MRIVGLLSFFDEPPELLAASIASLSEVLGAEALVAVDGRYDLYPGEEDVSPPVQHAAVAMACRHVGMGLTLHVPSGPWVGNEAEKRSALFALGHAATEPGDWFFVQDADQLLLRAPGDLRARLAGAEEDAAVVTFLDAEAKRMGPLSPVPQSFPVRLMYRRQDGPITVGPYHARYAAPDGRLLWHAGKEKDCVPALDAKDVVGEHRPNRRDVARLLAKQTYYAQRDDAAVELTECELCGEPARRRMTTRWRIRARRPVADTVDVCLECAARLERENVRKLNVLGIDASQMVISEHYGRPVGERQS